LGRKITLAHNNSQRSLASIHTGEVFLNREVLDQERNERVLSTRLMLEAGHELAFAVNVVNNVHAVDIEFVFDELGHDLLRNLTLQMLLYSHFAQKQPLIL
jgi:hypothetical protein